jgi:periplasmic protein TonB
MGLDTNRVLRVGVVFKGQILAERVLSRRTDVTVGTRADSTVQVSAKDHPEFPASIALALLHKDAYYLVLPDDPVAQVNLRGGAEGSQGVSKKDVTTVRAQRAVQIESYTGGSLALGDLIVMFQFVRSDSVPTVTHEETVLRIGLVYESRLLTDKVYQANEIVRVGADPGDTLVLPDIDYQGASARLEVHKDGSVKVTLPPKSGLRLATDGQPMDEAEALRKGIARKVGEGLELSIGLRARGRASLGPYTILFQVIRRTVTIPVMPRKTLIGQLLGPLMTDPVWSISFLVSVLLIGSIVGQAVIFQRTTGKFLKQQKLADEHIATTFEVLIEQKEEEEPEEVQDIKSDDAKKAEQEEIKKEEPEKKEAKKPESTGETVDPTERKKQVVEEVQRKSILGALGAGGAATKLFGEAGEGEEGSVMAKTFGGIGDEPADGPGAGGLKLEGGGGGGGGTMEIKAGGKAGFGTRDKDQTKVAVEKNEKKVVIEFNAGALGGSGTNKDQIGKVIARKNAAVRRCYENALRSNPGLSGKVTVRFTVGTAGTVTEVTVLGADGDFQDCIRTKFTRIRGLPILPAPQSFNQSYVFTKS